jgi:integrase
MGVTVRQKQSGKDKPWWVFINYQGRRKAKCVGDKKAADRVASVIREKLKKNEFSIIDEEKKVPCFKDYAKEWQTSYSKAFCKESTGDGYTVIINKHLIPFFSSTPIDQIKRQDVRRLIALKFSAGLAAGTIRNIRLCLSSILSTAVEDEVIQMNPAIQLGRKLKKFLQAKKRSSSVDFLTREEMHLFLESVKKHCLEYYAFLLCAARTGMRAGELIGLKPGDIDFNGMFIEVKRGIVRGKVTTTKSDKSRRVDMSRQLAETLRIHLLETKKTMLKKGWKEPPEWLFYNEQRNFLEINNVRKRYFHKCLEKAGLRRIRFHDLRHSFASLLISQGESLAYVRDQLGHSSIQITVDTYGHLVPGSNRQAVDKLDDMQPAATQAQPDGFKAEKKVLSITLST